MTYATQQNMIDRFGENAVIVATDRDNDGSIDAAVLSKALSDADTVINSYVAGLPGYPFDPVPDIFELLACEIAMYKASASASVGTEEQRTRYEDALSYLSKVGKQQIRLSTETGQDHIASDATAGITSTDRVFSRSDMDSLF